MADECRYYTKRLCAGEDFCECNRECFKLPEPITHVDVKVIIIDEPPASAE